MASTDGFNDIELTFEQNEIFVGKNNLGDKDRHPNPAPLTNVLHF